MLILTATNVTEQDGKKVLARADGTADYDVWLGINQHLIWRGSINGHKRDAGAATLLRLIADRVDTTNEMAKTMPVLTRIVHDANAADYKPGEALRKLKRMAKRVMPDKKRRGR